MISVAACVNRHLVLTNIDSTSLRHTHASHLQAPIKKPLGSAEKHNLQEIIGLTCRYAMKWNMLCRRQSIGEAASLLVGGGGEEVSPEWKNKSIASGKVARRNLKYAILSDTVCWGLWKRISIPFQCVGVLRTVPWLTWNKAPLHHLLVCPPSFVNFRWIRLCCRMKEEKRLVQPEIQARKQKRGPAIFKTPFDFGHFYTGIAPDWTLGTSVTRLGPSKINSLGWCGYRWTLVWSFCGLTRSNQSVTTLTQGPGLKCSTQGNSQKSLLKYQQKALTKRIESANKNSLSREEKGSNQKRLTRRIK